MLKYLLLYPAEAAVVLTPLVLLLRARVPNWLAWTVASGGILAFVVREVVYFPEGFDVKVFWSAGRVVWEGGDPYRAALHGGQKILNPPTALPLFLLLAALPIEAVAIVWAIFNVLACILLAPLARGVLSARGSPPGWDLSTPVLGVLTATVAFSYPSRLNLDAGQLSAFAALTLLLALYAQGQVRPLLAGAFLALASMKTATMLPFLLLFHRKKDIPSWLAMAVVGFGLCLLATPPQQLLDRCRECLDDIALLAGPGRVNDSCSITRENMDLIGLDHAIYRLGVRDRGVVRVLGYAGLVLLGGWLGWRIMGPKKWPTATACAFVGLYSALFLYHRVYDMMILALPLVYCVGCALAETKRVRWLYVLASVAILMVLYSRVGELESLTRVVQEGGQASRFIEAIVLPYNTYALLGAMLLLGLAERCRQILVGASSAGDHAGPLP